MISLQNILLIFFLFGMLLGFNLIVTTKTPTYQFGEGFSIPKKTLNQMAEKVETDIFIVCNIENKNCITQGNLKEVNNG